MSSLRAIQLLALTIFIFLFSLMGFNYYVDPQCYFRCSEIDINRKTTNMYYRAAQRIQATPSLEQIIVGSSRAQGTSELWVQDLTGLKTLNAAAAGSEVFSRAAYVDLAMNKHTLKRVIWYADYFELVGTPDERYRQSPALRKLGGETRSFELSDLKALISYITLEASLHFLGNSSSEMKDADPKKDYKTFQTCDDSYQGDVSASTLTSEMEVLYERYVRRVFSQAQTPQARNRFEKMLQRLHAQGVKILIVINPYNPHFMERLRREQPEIYKKHKEWVAYLKTRENDLVKVVDFMEGFPEDDGTSKYWGDGVHFTCYPVKKYISRYL